MVACVIELSEYAARRRGGRKPAPGTARTAAADNSDVRRTGGTLPFCFWHGASGERYVHTVYSLIDCPPLPRANYILVSYDSKGQRTVLRLGCVEHDAATLNLAELRHRGAKLAADEVHVHLLAKTRRARSLIHDDLKAALSGAAGARPLSA